MENNSCFVNKNEILKQKKTVFFLILVIMKTLSIKWTLQTLLIYSQLHKTRKTVLSVLF